MGARTRRRRRPYDPQGRGDDSGRRIANARRTTFGHVGLPFLAETVSSASLPPTVAKWLTTNSLLALDPHVSRSSAFASRLTSSSFGGLLVSSSVPTVAPSRLSASVLTLAGATPPGHPGEKYRRCWSTRASGHHRAAVRARVPSARVPCGGVEALAEGRRLDAAGQIGRAALQSSDVPGRAAAPPRHFFAGGFGGLFEIHQTQAPPSQ